MAKPNPNDNSVRGRKNADAEKEQVQEQEEEVQKDANESQKQDHLQNAVGNQAIQNQVMGNAANNPNGEGGGGGGMSMRKSGPDEDKDYGGSDDADPDAPLTLDDLVRSWNPTISKSEDRPSWLEPMPGDELPPEDPDFLEAVRTQGAITIKGAFTLESQLQPSRAVVAAGLVDWGRGLRTWTGNSLLERAICQVFVPGASFLQDPDGRALFVRVRTAAIGTLLMTQSPNLLGEPSSATVGFITFCLELGGHRRHAEMVRIDPGVEGKQMPKTTVVLGRSFEAPPNDVAPRALPVMARARLAPVLDVLLDLEDPAVYLPSLIANTPEDHDDDPLGLDAIMAQFTGAGPDLEEPLYYAAMQAAERLAAATARTRIHVASAAVAIAQVSRMWTAGPPMDALDRLAETVDSETDRNLRLLVEIARAAKKRSVPPKGLKAGLKRAVKGLRTVQDLAGDLLAETVGGVVPGTPQVLASAPPPHDALTDAQLDGEPRHALPWLRSLPPTPEHQAAIVLVELAAGMDAGARGPRLLELAAMLDGPLAEILEVLAGPCLLHGANHDLALALSSRHRERAIERRNGMLLANAVLLGVEAHRLGGNDEAAHALHLEGGRLAYAMAAKGAMSALARYTVPTPESP